MAYCWGAGLEVCVCFQCWIVGKNRLVKGEQLRF